MPGKTWGVLSKRGFASALARKEGGPDDGSFKQAHHYRFKLCPLFLTQKNIAFFEWRFRENRENAGAKPFFRRTLTNGIGSKREIVESR